ncbi:hypothetical protein KSP35_01830 [Aquihabitans sp. G128]|uniref:hypothetical protein n=1 Tax=Aquihabitans sp. G128 TaxID=2849779 RepID=UPI001C24647A|nr:hypothetical protein [Aquihabitans sp. G128]QXC61613.1 hypothetical protein KSP35_01830 [Aquihabitans sp. G128]
MAAAAKCPVLFESSELADLIEQYAARLDAGMELPTQPVTVTFRPMSDGNVTESSA